MDEEKIIVFSAGRTGSTFIWQIAKELVEDVAKCHMKEMNEGSVYLEVPCIVVERDPVDSYLSKLRCVQCDGDNDIFLEKIKDRIFLMGWAEDYKAELDYVKYVKQYYKGPVLSLFYSDFYKNEDYVFDKLEKFLNVEIDNRG